ncbi:MAG TPA: class I SAM-dependent methyltransferase [Gemmatimonadales bacterium]|nr:class I SAM-dependent methyltransferase [Gemmatimonadales bacterium]
MRRIDGEYVSLGDPSLRFPVQDGIVRAFVPHEPAPGDVTETIMAFYEDNPFPNYEGTEDVGSLIEKSVARGFPEMLNRSIPPSATVLEVGCGTGQLGNFLSIANRRVLSVDLCLNSLRLAQRFRDANGLTRVTFAQMNLFRLPLQPERFDVVICTGVLHHTAEPRLGFQGLLPLLKPGGHVLIGLYNRYGRLKTRCRRRLAGVLGERVAALDPYLEKFRVTRDKRRAWFMDQYRNPHESLHTMDEVLGWFDEAGIRFVRALPSTVFGSRFSLEYRNSLFDEESRGSRLDRLFSQLQQMVEDTEGGLFIVIGRRDGPR